MTIKDDINAAFDKLDPANGEQWNADGSPKLEAIRIAAGDQRIKRDEVTSALAGKRRPEQAAKPADEPAVKPEEAPAEQVATEQANTEQPPAPAPEEPVATGAEATAAVDPDAGREDTVHAVKPNVDGVEDTETPDRVELLGMAHASIETIDNESRGLDGELQKLQARMDTLAARRKKHEAFIVENEEHLTQADAVKRVQLQTQKNLAANKDRINVAAAAVKAAGVSIAPPASPLDAAYATRRKTPEMAANAAAYFRQRQNERVAERLGSV